jgi:hypothetical protein
LATLQVVASEVGRFGAWPFRRSAVSEVGRFGVRALPSSVAAEAGDVASARYSVAARRAAMLYCSADRDRQPGRQPIRRGEQCEQRSCHLG